MTTQQQLAIDSRPPLDDAAAALVEIVGPRGAPVIAVLGGISASRHVASSASDSSPGWWEDVVGPGRAIDTRQFRVICIDYATNQSRTDPVTTTDQAEALAAALDHAGVRSVQA